MIKDEIYEQLLSNGLSLDHYYLLCNIKSGKRSVSNKRIQGFINLLNKKDYIKDDKITEKGLQLIQDCTEGDVKKVSETYTNLQTWTKALHEKCQNLLVDLTGKKQVTDRINGKGQSFPFLPNVTDFSNKLTRVISLYQLKDYSLIEKALLRHITNCNDKKSWFPLMKYYILKDNASDMVTDMDNVGEEIVTFKSKQKLL